MTEQEAIKWLMAVKATQKASIHKSSLIERKEALHMAILAIEEIQQYRSIGTVEECREARQKQEPMKPITYQGTNRADCPVCGATVRGIKNPFGDWCSKCGKRLDWEME